MKVLAVAFALLAIVASAHAALPAFKTKGGPRNLVGVWGGEQDGYTVGVVEKNEYSYTTVTNKGENLFQYGKYLTHECLGGGKYRAIVEVSDISSAGKLIEKYNVCEIGVVDVYTGIYKWNQGKDKCPLLYKYTETRVSAYGVPSSAVC